MKLAAKLVLLFLLCLAVVVGVFAYLSIRQASDLVLTEHERHAADLAATLQSALKNSPQRISDVERVLAMWSREVQHVEIRVVNPSPGMDPTLRPSVPQELVITSTEVSTVLYPNASGQRMMYTYVPLDDEQGSRLEVAAPESFWTERLTRSLHSSAIALVSVAAVTSVVILLGGMWMVGQPLDQLVEKVRRIGQGDLSQPVELHRSDELGSLGMAVNEMCEQLSAQHKRIESETQQRIAAVEQLRHADRLRTVGRLAAGLAHEVGTPLNVVSGRAELICSGQLSAEEVRESALAIKTQSQRIASIVRELLDFARRSTPQRTSVDLNQLLLETTRLMRPMAAKREVTLDMQPVAGEALANVDPMQMRQVFTNLIMNAIHACQVSGRVAVQVRLAEEIRPPSGQQANHVDYWLVTVSDNGCGIAEEIQDDIFEPFFTTKDVGEGTGLGLSISYGIVREHDGWIDVHSQVGAGTIFGVYLPMLGTDVRDRYIKMSQ